MNKNQSIGMYVILGIMVLAFISMLFSGPTSSTEELSYTAFVQKVEFHFLNDNASKKLLSHIKRELLNDDK